MVMLSDKQIELSRELMGKVNFRIIELSQLGPAKSFGFDSTIWAEDKEGNKYFEMFGRSDRIEVLHYNHVRNASMAMARFVADRMTTMTIRYEYKLTPEGHLHHKKDDPETVPVKVIHLTKPKDWPNMQEPPWCLNE